MRQWLCEAATWLGNGGVLSQIGAGGAVHRFCASTVPIGSTARPKQESRRKFRLGGAHNLLHDGGRTSRDTPTMFAQKPMEVRCSLAFGSSLDDFAQVLGTFLP